MVVTLTGLLISSGTLVAFAPSYPVFMLGRVLLLAVAIGDFWSRLCKNATPRLKLHDLAFARFGGTTFKWNGNGGFASRRPT